MIVPMKLVTLLCLEQDRTAAVDALAGLELMQLCRTAPPATKDVASISAQLTECERVIGIVRSAPAMKNPPAAPEVADDELVAYASMRVFPEDAWGCQCPFMLCLHPQGCLQRGVRATRISGSLSCGAREVRSP